MLLEIVAGNGGGEAKNAKGLNGGWVGNGTPAEAVIGGLQSSPEIIFEKNSYNFQVPINLSKKTLKIE